jgi:hypothetical protein
MILFTLFIDAIFTDMGRFTFRALHFDFLHSYLYYATPKFILEERNLQKQDLLSIFESKSTLDDIFDGLQELTPIYIQKLANFLNISPDLFFPS